MNELKNTTRELREAAQISTAELTKQKTAYEMESRDWSSDVCSSDLTQRPKRKDSNYAVDQWTNPQRWKETSAKSRKTPETRAPHLLQRTKTPHKQGNKIGRASCRERVFRAV